MNKKSLWLTYIFMIPFSAMILILLYYSTIKSEYFELGLENEVPTTISDRPFWHIIVIVILIALLTYSTNLIKEKRFSKFKSFLKSKYFRYVLVAYSGIISFFILILLSPKAYMDCLSLIDAAERFNVGDYSLLTDPSHSSYLYIYSFQIGFIAYLQLVFKLFGNGNIWAVQFFNCIGVMFMINSLCKISKLVFKSHKISTLSMFLLVFAMPLYINIVFVYGDVLGWSLAVCALYHVIAYTKYRKMNDLIISNILLPIGYLLKTNIAIFIIACIVILIIDCIRNKKVMPLLFVITIPLVTLILSASLRISYAKVAGIDEFPKGAPAVCWIAMSMLDDGYFPAGWYNGYNINTFKESSYNYEIAQDMAMETIKERLTYFKNNPRRMLRFYRDKFISAWIDPEFDSQIKLEWSTRHNENLSPLAISLISGTLRNVLFTTMNFLQVIIFAGTVIELLYLWFMLIKCRSNTAADTYIYVAFLLLPVFGGMTFHLIWETQPRYMICYYCILFPIAAAGLIHLSNSLYQKIQKA